MKNTHYILMLLVALVAQAKPAFEELPPEKIAALKKKPCALIHVWATWCTTCLQELPDLIKVLGSMKQVTPVVIDVSSQFVQQNFSRKWAATLKAPFKTYVKPGVKDEVYLNAIDKEWSGGLPFSALYHNGLRKKTWNGSIDLSTLRQEVAELCR